MWIKQYGIQGIVGALLGILLVSWIQPSTSGGVGLILLISVLLSVAVSALISLLRKK
jgi:hypothetical protein